VAAQSLGNAIGLARSARAGGRTGGTFGPLARRCANRDLAGFWIGECGFHLGRRDFVFEFPVNLPHVVVPVRGGF
jgi:hypothetical protein